ncbi:HNH endonuclease [Aquisalimonas lutea]|nr:HNH endonuclease [Aquisalimonas lutea]MDN3516766.1 HNH endonuclease [Aquisalimonas lutea]
MLDLSNQILRTDVSGMPLEWITYQEAARLYYLDQVVFSCGRLLYRVRGGYNAVSGHRSILELNSIIATNGSVQASLKGHSNYTPPLDNKALFRRDDHICMYCGGRFRTSGLSRDHVTPISQSGQDVWTNVVAACKRCNNDKAGRTPEQAGMQLLAVPFKPTHAEYVYLQGRRILADQMEFLRAHFPRTSPLRHRSVSDELAGVDVPSGWA